MVTYIRIGLRLVAHDVLVRARLLLLRGHTVLAVLSVIQLHFISLELALVRASATTTISSHCFL